VALVGLSGCLGSGKSTVGRALAARGAAVIDTDQVARDVVAVGTPGARAVLDHFGPAVQGLDGGIDRRALGAIVFADPAQRLALESITHPLIHQEVRRRATALGDRLVVVEVPLLDGARRHQYGFDAVVLVEAGRATALRRAVERGLSEAQARARLDAQPSTAERRQVADYTIVNEGSLQQLGAAVDLLWEWLASRRLAP
jgi:dephospho-CoA kinase